MRQPCRMIVVYNKTHQTKKKIRSDMAKGKRIKKMTDLKWRRDQGRLTIVTSLFFVCFLFCFLAVRFLMDVT